MLPVSTMHFLVTAAYVVIFLAIVKMVAVKTADRPVGKALGFLVF